jgi:protein-S-isoprenylcysteine O-methyltransferase Ste14
MNSFLRWFQIATVILFVLILTAKFIFLRTQAGINPIAIGRGKRGFQLFFEIYSFLGLVVWMIEILLRGFDTGFRIFPSSIDIQLIDSTAAKALGVLLVTLGFTILLWAFYSFGNSWRVGFDTKTPGALVTSGIFGLSRNPIYLFLDLWFVGVFLINGTLVFLIFALLALSHLHYQIIREERFMDELYGEPYRDYRSRTGRYFWFA